MKQKYEHCFCFIFLPRDSRRDVAVVDWDDTEGSSEDDWQIAVTWLMICLPIGVSALQAQHSVNMQYHQQSEKKSSFGDHPT